MALKSGAACHHKFYQGNMKIPRRRIIVTSLLFFGALTALGAGIFYWLKMPYSFAPQRRLAETFINYVNEEEFEKAFELTRKNGYTGQTLKDFQAKASSEIRGPGYKFAYSYPPQSNGNRLRRRLKGTETEMGEVSLEFTGPSLLRITLRRSGDNEWKVFFITSHAG